MWIHVIYIINNKILKDYFKKNLFHNKNILFYHFKLKYLN
jgi:hypothetical protein